MIGVIQLPMLRIANVEISSMLGRFWTSISEPMPVDPFSNDASFTISFAVMFSLLGICMNSTLSNSYVKCFVSLRYFCTLSSFTSYSSFICPITSFESLWRRNFLAPSAFLTLSPVNIPLYLASLLVAGKFS